VNTVIDNKHQKLRYSVVLAMRFLPSCPDTFVIVFLSGWSWVPDGRNRLIASCPLPAAEKNKNTSCRISPLPWDDWSLLGLRDVGAVTTSCTPIILYIRTKALFCCYLYHSQTGGWPGAKFPGKNGWNFDHRYISRGILSFCPFLPPFHPLPSFPHKLQIFGITQSHKLSTVLEYQP